jgi:hypothetical protein
MKRTLKKATVRTFYYQIHQHLKEHLQAFLMANSFAKRLKTLKGITLSVDLCHLAEKPDRFPLNPIHYTLRLNTEVESIGAASERHPITPCKGRFGCASASLSSCSRATV